MALIPAKKPVKEGVDPNTVHAVFGLSSITYQHKDSKATPINTACPSLLYGVELEIENARRWGEWIVPGLSGKEDGSLRNNGIEFISEPMTISILNQVLTEFFEKSKVNDSNYSERCSVHVHANCKNLTIEQVATIALLYQVFEHLLFRFVGNDRDKNIFCVPWYETTLMYNVIHSLNKQDHSTLQKWLKYTALNLLPLYKLGTIEFRQMAGTYDKEKIINWCNLIGCMFQYAMDHKLPDVEKEFVALNTTSAYRGIMDSVFRSWADLLKTPDYELLLEEGVLNMKYALLNPKEVEERVKPKTPKVLTVGLSSVFNADMDRFLNDERREMDAVITQHLAGAISGATITTTNWPFQQRLPEAHGDAAEWVVRYD